MVLLAGDLFNENKPERPCARSCGRCGRKMKYLGNKPVELRMLSDASENVQGCVCRLVRPLLTSRAFGQGNYEVVPDLIVATFVFLPTEA